MGTAMYSPPPFLRAAPHTITPYSPESIGAELAGLNGIIPASNAYPSADLVLYIPFRIGQAFTVVEVSWFNGAVTGNGDAQVGVYDEAGAEIVECTATTTSGTSVIQTVDVTDTTLTPGRYYMAFRAHSGTDRFFSSAPAAGLLQACGVLQQTGQTDLPATATFAVGATAYLPTFGIQGHTLL